jgi:hypothetical protein
MLVVCLALTAAFSVGCSGGSDDDGKSTEAVCAELPPLAVKDTYGLGFGLF